jgi:hypothetical protein
MPAITNPAEKKELPSVELPPVATDKTPPIKDKKAKM